MPSGWPGHRWHSHDPVVLAKMQSGQPGPRPAGRDAVGSAGTPSGWPRYRWHSQDAVVLARCSRVSWDAIRLAGTPLNSQDAVVMAKMPSGQPGRRPAGRDAVGSAGTQLDQPDRHPAGRDTVCTARTSLCWSRCRRVSRDAFRLAGTQCD